MKTITATEAQIKITEFIAKFQELCSFGPGKFTATIENVRFADIVILYMRIKTPLKQIYLPGEMDTETMMIIYTPAPGCVICIESEPCLKPYRNSFASLNMN